MPTFERLSSVILRHATIYLSLAKVQDNFRPELPAIIRLLPKNMGALGHLAHARLFAYAFSWVTENNAERPTANFRRAFGMGIPIRGGAG